MTSNIFDDAIQEIWYTVIDTTKEFFETMDGVDYGETKNEIDYYNFLVDNPIIFSSPDGSFNISDIGGPTLTSGQTKANGIKVINSLMNLLGLTKEQAAGIAGVMTAESGINPHIVNAGEKSGKYTSSSANNTGAPYGDKHCPWSYGAGICQWTFTQRKESAIMGGLKVSREQAKKIIMGGGIESLSLDDQIKMLAYELETSYKHTLNGIKKCSSAARSAATFYCHSIAGYSSSDEPASNDEIAAMNKKYNTVGADNQINKGMKYAEGYMQG